MKPVKTRINKYLILEVVSTTGKGMGTNDPMAQHPWDIDMKASAEQRNLMNAASRENLKTDPAQYFMNWYIRGPFKHLSSEAYGKLAEMLYNILKNTESVPITSVSEFQKELSKINGPWNREKEATRLGLEKMNTALTKIKNKSFMHWILNPFVKGELNSNINYKLKEDLIIELNRYGSGKDDYNNEAAIDSTRSIAHKRTLDKMATDVIASDKASSKASNIPTPPNTILTKKDLNKT
jgi:hypothetical protein